MSSSRVDLLIRRDSADGIGFFRVGGIFTPTLAPLVMADNHAWLVEQRLPAQVVSYERAALAVSPEQVFAAAKTVIGSARTGGMLTPTALLVSPDTLPMWRSYCWMMAQAGVARAAFVSEEEARRWAAESGALWEAQQRHQKRGQSPR